MTDRSLAVAPVALAVLVVLAGCGAIQSTDSTTGTEPTATTERATTVGLADLTFPDGADREGIQNASAVFEAHESAIADQGYEVEAIVSETSANGSQRVRNRYVIRSSVDEREQYRYLNSTSHGESRTTISYRNETGVYKKYVEGDVSYDAKDSRVNVSSVHRQNDINDAVKSILKASEYEDARVVRQKGRALIEYQLDEITNETFFGRQVANESGSIRMTRDGAVQSVSLSFTTESDGTERRVRIDVTYTELGDVDVRKPDWVSEAVESRRTSSNDGDDSKVSGRVQVVTAFGNVTENGRIDHVNLTVMRPAGADVIDLSDATIEWIGPEKATTLTYGERTSEAQFAVTAVRDDNGSVPVLDEHDDRHTITIDVSKVSDELGAGEEATLKITTASGAVTLYRVDVPESLEGESAVVV